MRGVPQFDVGPLLDMGPGAEEVGRALDRACREVGFFTVVGHGLDRGLQARLARAARSFFARPDADKAEIAMARGGRAWRGWFPVGGEVTSGVPDRKEGIYFGAELPPDDPRVRTGLPLHGPNLFPSHPEALRGAVLDLMVALSGVGHALARGLALGLGLPADWFAEHLTGDPTLLFRIFRYPPPPDDGRQPEPPGAWGVGEHTDYGLLTLLWEDGPGGLEVRTPTGWVDVDVAPGALVCNLGDVLERMTGGRYRSTPHRVRPTPAGADRLSFPFFFDPAWDAALGPIPGFEPVVGAPGPQRWDGADVQALSGTYGAYLLSRVRRVFPDLGSDVLDASP